MFQISQNKRYFLDKKGEPFFWLGDTAWELCHRLSKEEICYYMDKRKAQGFDLLFAVILAELDGLNCPNSEGHCPLIDNDPCQPNDEYFKLVDYIVQEATNRGMMMALLPTWGDKFNIRNGIGPEVFTPENAAVYGEWLGNRYKDANLIWVLGGDRPLATQTHYDIIDAMAAGLQKGDNGNHLLTYHPNGGVNVLEDLGDRKWLSFAMIQSGHAQHSLDNFNLIAKDYNYEPHMPILDGEPCYEEMPRMDRQWSGHDGYFNEDEVRRASFWSILSGSCSHVYGAAPAWLMHKEPLRTKNKPRMSWREALELPGAQKVHYAKEFYIKQKLYSMHPNRDFVVQSPELYEHVAVMIDDKLENIIYYSPILTPVTIKELEYDYNITKYNPATNEYSCHGTVKAGKAISLDNILGTDEVTILTKINL